MVKRGTLALTDHLQRAKPVNTTEFPLPLGSACRWAHKQTQRLQLEGFSDADLLSCCQSLFFRFAKTGNESHMATIHRLLVKEVQL